jgi:hypothetical protein
MSPGSGMVSDKKYPKIKDRAGKMACIPLSFFKIRLAGKSVCRSIFEKQMGELC